MVAIASTAPKLGVIGLAVPQKNDCYANGQESSQITPPFAAVDL